MSLVIRCLLSLSLIVLLASFDARADVITFPRTKFSFHQTLYSGKAGHSLAESGSGVGAEVMVQTDGAWIPAFVRGRVVSATGTQDFLDGETAVASGFNFYQAQADVGANFFPLSRRRGGVNIYIGASFSVGYAYVALDQGVTLSEIQHTDQSVVSGGSASLGGEWILSNTTPRKWTLATELTYRKEQANLLGRSDFDLSSIVLSAGFGW